MRLTPWLAWAVEKSKEELEDEALLKKLEKEAPRKPYTMPEGAWARVR